LLLSPSPQSLSLSPCCGLIAHDGRDRITLEPSQWQAAAASL
jgi:hypothetical protein